MRILFGVIVVLGLSIQAAMAVEDGPQDICINKKTLSGCCSGKIGVMGATRDGVVCLNGEMSPTCEQEIVDALTGCCSHNDGVFYVDPESGAVICKSGKTSSCTASLNKCMSESTSN